MPYFTGVSAEMKTLRDGLKAFREASIKEVRLAAITVIQALQSKTPVWSGETVRNYAVGLGTRPTGATRKPIDGDPGNTSSQPLGPENMRSDNEAAAVDDAMDVLSRMRRLQNVVIGNLVSADKWDLVDSGSAPSPERARYPGGVAMAGEQKARQLLGRNWR